jgi:hypothetical protein
MRAWGAAAIVLAAIAGIFELVGKHVNYVIGLLIVAVICAGIGEVWTWRRGRGAA